MDLVAELGSAIARLQRDRARVLVAIDGPDAAGKTTLADRLADRMPRLIRASIDHFEHETAHRIRHGRGGDTYYRDGFDIETLRRETLEPFAAGAAQVKTSHRDPQTDELRPRYADVPERATLVVDGVFLQKPAIRDLWSLVVYLAVSPETSLERARVRDLGWNDTVEDIEHGYAVRYLPGQVIYRETDDPESTADYLIDNTDPDAPVVLRQPRDPR